MSVQLVWFKRDLRTSDHTPLMLACAHGPTIGLYVYEPELIEAADSDAAHLTFVNESLSELRENLRQLGGELLLRVGEMPKVLDELSQTLPIAKVWAHEETHNDKSYQRDRRVRAWSKSRGIPMEEIPQYGVVRRLKDRDGWSAQRSKRMSQPVLEAPKQIQSFKGLANIELGRIRQPEEFHLNSFARTDIQKGGETLAAETLHTFLQQRGVSYRTDMSSPLEGENGCSRISPYLAYGNISMRTIHHQLTTRVNDLKNRRKTGDSIEPTWLKSLSSYRSRLSWHCHFMQKLEDEPTIEFDNFNRAYDGLREAEFDQQKFDSWCAGQTGYPMVDACMRALHQTGWINFRMRAMLVSFSSYHLWLHWREPALYLARLFLDYEPGIHYSQVQMQSGVTGINTIRIYSPIKQALDQDPAGDFIRRYVPELENVPTKHIAQPHLMNAMEQTLFQCRIGIDYPKPIVDHSTQYKIARDRIHAVKRDPATRAASQKVFQKHGSRKTPMSQR